MADFSFPPLPLQQGVQGRGEHSQTDAAQCNFARYGPAGAVELDK